MTNVNRVNRESPPTPPLPGGKSFEVVMSPEKFRVRLTARRTTAKSDGEGQASQQDQGPQTKVIYC
jgi:hypothetical protein